jgi:hypothetical protein
MVAQAGYKNKNSLNRRTLISLASKASTRCPQSLLRLKAVEQMCRFYISVFVTGSKMFFGERFS